MSADDQSEIPLVDTEVVVDRRVESRVSVHTQSWTRGPDGRRGGLAGHRVAKSVIVAAGLAIVAVLIWRSVGCDEGRELCNARAGGLGGFAGTAAMAAFAVVSWQLTLADFRHLDAMSGEPSGGASTVVHLVIVPATLVVFALSAALFATVYTDGALGPISWLFLAVAAIAGAVCLRIARTGKPRTLVPPALRAGPGS